jgi:hypothetical protein
MTKLIALAALMVVLSIAAGPALGSNCPVVIKQGREAAAKMKADDPKVKQATAKLDEAQKLHDGGKHSESLKTADEALMLLGVKKK